MKTAAKVLIKFICYQHSQDEHNLRMDEIWFGVIDFANLRLLGPVKLFRFDSLDDKIGDVYKLLCTVYKLIT